MSRRKTASLMKRAVIVAMLNITTSTAIARFVASVPSKGIKTLITFLRLKVIYHCVELNWDSMISELEVFFLTMLSALVAAYAQLLFKTGAVKFSFSVGNVMSLLRRRMIILGLLLYAVSLAVYLYALRFGELSFVYPAFSSTFIFVMLISRFKLKERITPKRAIGIAMIMLGIFLVVIS